MKILEPFEDPALVRGLTERIARLAARRDLTVLMEVCGTHTQAIGRWGLRGLMPENVRLVSGPGCPVCVTPAEYIDHACRLALEAGAILTTFGDLVRVPGLKTSLEAARGAGAEVRTVYSPREALTVAEATDREVVFLAVGFETTIAGHAATIRAARERGVRNLSFYTSLRLIPPALAALIADPEVRLDGFLLPGHVSVIIGEEPYREVLLPQGPPGAIIGFEPVHILHGVAALLEALDRGGAVVRNLYRQVVRPEGNPAARRLFEEVFEPEDAVWRGIGVIPRSGYRLKARYARLDAARRFGLPPLSARTDPRCRCGEVLKGVRMPSECPLFGGACTPEHPVGPCMVSAEGSCSAHYRYADA